MDFLLSWLVVLVVEIGIWILLSRVPRLRPKIVDRISARKLPNTLKRFYKTSLETDCQDRTGFVPPRITRAIIKCFIIAQDAAAISIQASKAEKPLNGISISSGKLALANLFLLFLFGSHEIIIVKVLHHSKPQALWVHNILAWMVVFETLIHVNTSLPLMSSMTSRNNLIGWIMGFIASLSLCFSIKLSSDVTTRVSRTFHGVVGIVGIVGIIVHLFRSTACLLLGLGIMAIGATGIHSLWRPGYIGNAKLDLSRNRYDDEQMVQFQLRVPDNRHDFYIKSCGKFYRAAWVTEENSQHEATMLIPRSAGQDVSSRGGDALRVSYDGPFRSPFSSYRKLAQPLDIIASGSSMYEAYSCFMKRQELLEPKGKAGTLFPTRLTWFITQPSILYPFYKHLSSKRSSWLSFYNVVLLVLAPVDDTEISEYCEGNLRVEYETSTDLKSAIERYLRNDPFKGEGDGNPIRGKEYGSPINGEEYIVGEHLRSLLEE